MIWFRKQRLQRSVIYWSEVKWPNGLRHEVFQKWVRANEKMLTDNVRHIQASVKLGIMDPQHLFNLVIGIAHDCLVAGFKEAQDE